MEVSSYLSYTALHMAKMLVHRTLQSGEAPACNKEFRP